MSDEPLTPTVAAVQRDLDAIGERDKNLAKCGLAQVALRLAEGIDADNSLTSKAMAAKELGRTLAELRELAPAERKKDGIDQLKQKRAEKESGKARAAS